MDSTIAAKINNQQKKRVEKRAPGFTKNELRSKGSIYIETTPATREKDKVRNEIKSLRERGEYRRTPQKTI